MLGGQVARFIELSGKFLGAHLVHTALILVWAETMSMIELSHFILEKPLYEQGFILLPHLFELGGNLYSHFIISILHLISAGILALGGIYHAIVGAERLEETSSSALFAYGLQDRFRITAILGSHLITLGIGASLLFAKAVYLGGLYDTWVCGGGDIRLIERVELGLNPYLLALYLLRAPFGSSGWIISIHNMKYIITLSAVTLCSSITALFSLVQ